MVRDFQIPGEILVSVKGNGALHKFLEPNVAGLYELGLASEGIRITPTLYHRDIHADDFGPDVPAAVMWNAAECTITMNLIHFDRLTLERCIRESMGGATDYGTLAPTGTMMDNGLPLFFSGNHYISLNLAPASQVNPDSYRFPCSYLTGRPVEYPLSTEKSIARLIWRAVPLHTPGFVYEIMSGSILAIKAQNFPNTASGNTEITSSGSILWTRELDTQDE